MAGTFAEAAVRVGRVVCALGWRPGEFWGATPGEVAMLIGADATPGAVTGDELRRMMREDGDGQRV